MDILGKVLSYIGLARGKAVGPLPDDRTIYKSLRQILGDNASIVKKPYSESIWVYAAIHAIATNVSMVPFVIRRDIGAGLSK